MNNEKFLAECRTAPRITTMKNFFSETASGVSNIPIKKIVADKRLFNDEETVRFHAYLSKHKGFFLNHYFSSIPYSFEEECRLGKTIVKYLENINNPTVYCLGMAEGSMARAISDISLGRIKTLTSSPTKENEKTFYENGHIPGAVFAHTPFSLIKEKLDHFSYGDFKNGFNILIEDTTFQMYSPDRFSQIGFVKTLLKDDGILIITEKFKCDKDEYLFREYQKDYSFKRRFFSESQLSIKKEKVLNTMSENEVTLEEARDALDPHFKHKAIYWNSGNFYSIAASSSKENLDLFLSLLGKECIPSEYVYIDLPKKL
mgnify:CR=1 FL=1|jgi:hypothetical protein